MDKQESITVKEQPIDLESQENIPPPLPPRELVNKEWPTEAHPLEEDRNRWTVIAYDTVLILLPLALLAKAIVVAVYGQSGDMNGQLDLVPPELIALAQFNDQLVTLFTIVFGTIVATLVKRYALWKAQRGASVSTLEQLQSSISLPKTLSLIWSLRAFSLTSISLVLIWSWYYLGSQAVSRELGFHDSEAPYDLKIAYLNSEGPSPFDNGAPNSTLLTRANARFMNGLLDPTSAAFASQTKAVITGWDRDGNTLLPIWDPWFARTFDNMHMDKHGWWETDLQQYQIWSSMLGVPFKALFNQSGCISSENPYGCYLLTNKVVGTVTLNTSYIQANCSEIELKSGISNSTIPQFNTLFNMTNAAMPSIQVAQRYNESMLQTTCNLTHTDIRLEVECGSQGCKSVKAHPTPNVNLRDSFFYNSTLAQLFLDNMVQAFGAPVTDGAPLPSTDGWFLDFKSKDMGFSGTQSYTGAEMALYSSRGLTKLINSYLSASQQSLIDTIDTQSLMQAILGSPQDNLQPAIMKGAPYSPQYRISWPWMALDFVSCVVLLVASSVAVAIGKRTLAPDVFGYVSSLTRDNPNIELPEGGSTLSGLDRARMLKKVKVQLADVSGPDGVGRVGLTMMARNTDSSDGVSKLQKGKQYL